MSKRPKLTPQTHVDMYVLMESLVFFEEKMADKCKIKHKGCTASDKFALIVVLPKIPQIPQSFFGQSTQIGLNIWDMFEKSPYSVSVVRGT